MKKTIYWADDDPDDIEIFREVLEQANNQYQINDFRNGRDLINRLHELEKEEQPNLIILDMNMPVLNGRETLAILKSEEKFSSIPVVVFTTSRSEMDKLFCKRFNVEMITKPSAYEALKTMVPEFVKRCN